jgi:hypothetical protein
MSFNTDRPRTYSAGEMRKRWNRLSYWRREWVRHKANWEHITVSAVLHDYHPVPRARECERMMRQR